MSQLVYHSWGVRHHHQFIDGFHTGFNLEALGLFRENAFRHVEGINEAIQSGLDYYRSHLFTCDGVAKYYHDCQYPLDTHSFSQGILTFLKLSSSTSDDDLVQKIVHKLIETLYLPQEKRFMYQVYKRYTNKIDYMRWTQAWAYYGLAYWHRFVAENQNKLMRSVCRQTSAQEFSKMDTRRNTHEKDTAS